jgi:hypothetical protein
MLARSSALGFGALLLAGCGITGDYRRDPGYAAFDSAAAFAEHREVGLSLGPTPLALARWVADEEDPRAGAILAELRAVRVYVYEGIPDSERMTKHLRGIESGLLDDGWRSVATVREDDSRVSVLLRPNGSGGSHGLAVIVQEPKELVLVNLIGNVRLDLVADYMAELDIDTPKIVIDPQTL